MQPLRTLASLLWLPVTALALGTNAEGLRSLLSRNASISHNASTVPRWSDFDAPKPRTIVNVATEHDVLVTVRYCVEKNIKFLAQNGGHGWATTFNLGSNGLLINLGALNGVTFNANKTEATVQGGALINDTIAAAYANGVQVQTGNCNRVGTLGTILGGGYGNLLGLHGFGVDNLISLNVVTASGSMMTITPKDTELWWAFRGAGPNFGIVTSAVMKSFPVQDDQLKAWLGPLTFTEDKIEPLVQAIDNLVLEPEMNIFLYYLTSRAPDYTPMIVSTLFYYGNETAGKAAFASIYDVGPSSDGTVTLEYNHWNDGSAGSCVKGGRKPSYGAAFTHMVPSTWGAVWDEFVAFVKTPGTGDSQILLEAYSLFKARSLPDNSSSFPFRSTVNFNAVAIPWYSNSSLDRAAEAFGSKTRGLWRSANGLERNSTYVNFAHGDENLSTVYRDSLSRLKAIKTAFDPLGRFNQWYPL